MTQPRITFPALDDLKDIHEELSVRAGTAMADQLAERLFRAIDELGRLTSLGHTHQDLDLTGVLCHVSSPYIIVFRREPRVVVLRVVHGKRDLSTLRI